jgi:hypothetical protein
MPHYILAANVGGHMNLAKRATIATKTFLMDDKTILFLPRN